MTRPYFVNVTIDLADEEDRVPGEHTGRGFGFRIEDPLKDGQHGEFFAERLQRALAETAAREVERDRKLAEPFWKRWLGGV